MRSHQFILVPFLVNLLCLLQESLTLKCRTEEGPTSEEVRRVIRICMNRIGTDDSENKTTTGYEYNDYDSPHSEMTSEEQGENEARRRDSNQKGYGGGINRNDRERNTGDIRNAGRNQQANGRNGNENHAYGMRNRNNDGINRNGRYKRQFYDDDPQGRYGYQQTDRYNQDRNRFMKSNGNNSGDSANRDRACFMQCFFQEMKMTNNDGFPDKHKVLHVITKDMRNSELRDFYIDSIQECFHMISMDNQLKDKCDFALRFVSCLADRSQANCNDWENETIIF
ncbi:general odorant-binding protein 71 [Malaya genurostris]|uniref:general odorant-binding protein 71 n=1 Tax=Malaya genurostris TaxID=325434 RepID=UPI0026F3C6CC|nr:general odorant-binding protein 71 [Malaya genurostris]